MRGGRIQEAMLLLMRPLIGSCAETEARLSDYVDGELSTGKARRLRLHLACCRGCRGMFGSFARGIEQIRALGRDDLETPTPSVADAVTRRIRDDPR